MERDEAAFANGHEAARADVAAGRLIYRWRGHAGHWGHWIANELFVRFGMETEGLGICLVDAATTSFNDGYNGVVLVEIDRRQGHDAFNSLVAESRNQPEENLWDAKQAWMRHQGPAEPGSVA